MVSEQQASKELMTRNWSFAYFEGLDRIDARLKELGVPPDQVLQLIEANNELKDADFRAAAFDLLELKKRTGKNSKEAEAYTKGLDSQITSKEKQGSDWIGRIEKAKAEFRDWEQKRNDEKVKFESEQAQNKRILKEDSEKLARELKRNDVVRDNVEETIALKAELKKINLDLDTFKSIVRETVLTGGITEHIAKDITEAVKRLDSLDKAIQEKERQVTIREKAIVVLSRQEEEKKRTLRGLDEQIAVNRQAIAELDQEIERKLKSVELWDERVEKRKWQYQFFELFISMLLSSPSVSEPLVAIGEKVLQLGRKGWTHSRQSTPEQRRTAFITLVMGGYLHSIHCRNCGASFLVNKAPNAYSSWRSSYYCPVCDFQSYTKPDDTFFDLMVSPELTKKFQDTRALLDIIGKTDLEALREKLKLLDSVPSEVYKALSEGRRIEVKVLDGTD